MMLRAECAHLEPGKAVWVEAARKLMCEGGFGTRL